MPHAIILFLFGLTLITVSPVFAQDPIDMSRAGEERDQEPSLDSGTLP